MKKQLAFRNEKIKLYWKRYYKKHKAQIMERAYINAAKNPERFRAYQSAYYYKHKNRKRLLMRAWRKRNMKKMRLYFQAYTRTPRMKEYYRARQHSRRALATAQNLTVQVIQRVYEENIQKYGTLTCELCFRPVIFGQDALDHKIPIQRQADFPRCVVNARENLGVAHGNNSVEKCNSRKSDKTVREYWQYLKEVAHG